MFEKEGIRYAFEETIGTECLSKPVEDFNFIDLSDEQQEKAQCWKDGAEFGYNKANEEVEEKYKETICNLEMNLNSVTEQLEELEKANEWHYVKDGITPTHSYRVLVYTDEGVGFGIYGHDDKKWHTYDTGFDVIAWKEIVLPKESE